MGPVAQPRVSQAATRGTDLTRDADQNSPWLRGASCGPMSDPKWDSTRTGCGWRQALANAWPPYLGVTLNGGGEDSIDGVTERTRRELATWPTSTSVVDELVSALQKAADAETAPPA
jgi:hypothetical protein